MFFLICIPAKGPIRAPLIPLPRKSLTMSVPLSDKWNLQAKPQKRDPSLSILWKARETAFSEHDKWWSMSTSKSFASNSIMNAESGKSLPVKSKNSVFDSKLEANCLCIQPRVVFSTIGCLSNELTCYNWLHLQVMENLLYPFAENVSTREFTKGNLDPITAETLVKWTDKIYNGS